MQVGKHMKSNDLKLKKKKTYHILCEVKAAGEKMQVNL